MKNLIFYLIALLTTVSFSACQPNLKQNKIQEGIVNLSGKLIDTTGENPFDNEEICLYVSDVVTGSDIELRTQAINGSFHFDIPVTTKYSIGGLVIERLNLYLRITLIQKEENRLDITFNNGDIVVNERNGLPFNSYDILHISPISIQLEQQPSCREFRERYDLSPDEFRQAVFSDIQCRIDTVMNADTLLSVLAKEYIINEFKLHFIRSSLFEYPESMEWNYETSYEKTADFVKPAQPERSYYSFLKDLKLNNLNYLLSYYYKHILKAILSNDTLNITPIENIPIEKWLKNTKEKLSDLVGFDNSLFYDLLTSNAYCQQFNNEIKPLSETQINNINFYWKNNDMAKILLKKNEKIVLANGEKTPSIKNETPQMPKEQLIDAIVSKYKGNVTLIDFWATWCAPCMEAMQEIFPMKSQLKDKNIVFVYITGETSPKKLWEERIKGIGGEHYYLTNDQWTYMGEYYQFTGIPFYLLFDKNGKLIDKYLGYPGNDTMRQMIEKLLP